MGFNWAYKVEDSCRVERTGLLIAQESMHNLKLMAELLFTSCYQKSLLMHSFVQKKKASEFKKLRCGIRDFCIFVLSMHTLLFSPKWTRSLANQHHQGDFQLHSRNRPFTFFVVLVAVITARCATFCGPWATFNETLISHICFSCVYLDEWHSCDLGLLSGPILARTFSKTYTHI